METKYKREINYVCLNIELPCFYEEDYQMPMLRANVIPGLLRVEGRGIDEKSQYSYDVSGMASMKALYDTAEMGGKELEDFVTQLMELMETMRSYMLDADGLVLDPDHIFFRKGRYWFCYLPVEKQPLCTAFHQLAEYFVSKVNYQENAAIQLACELHKATMKENYDLAQIIEEYKNNQEEESAAEAKEIEERGNIFELEDEPLEYVPDKPEMLRERGSIWKPLEKAKHKFRQTKWGKWEDLILDTDGQDSKTHL